MLRSHEQSDLNRTQNPTKNIDFLLNLSQFENLFVKIVQSKIEEYENTLTRRDFWLFHLHLENTKFIIKSCFFLQKSSCGYQESFDKTQSEAPKA